MLLIFSKASLEKDVSVSQRLSTSSKVVSTCYMYCISNDTEMMKIIKHTLSRINCYIFPFGKYNRTHKMIGMQ